MRVPEKVRQLGKAPTRPLPALEITAAGQKYNQVHQFVYRGGLITEDADLTRDINPRINIACRCFRKILTELFDRPSETLRIKTRLLKAEAIEALLCECMTWPPRNVHYRQLRTTHHKLLLQDRVQPRSRHLSTDVVRKSPQENREPKGGSDNSPATASVRGGLDQTGRQATPEAAVVRRETRGGGRPGPRPAGTALAKNLEGRL